MIRQKCLGHLGWLGVVRKLSWQFRRVIIFIYIIKEKSMSKFRMFTEQSRQEILKSLTNNSSSKQAWSFSKCQRFKKKTPNCPYATYMVNTSTLSNKKPSFGNSKRKVFTQVSEGPSSWVYNPLVSSHRNAATIGAGRSEIIANSYIPLDPLKNPGPGNYKQSKSPRRGYSMRPKTAHTRNYFIDDKQRETVPGPGNYDNQGSSIGGKKLLSKFKSAALGASMNNKSSRFFRSTQKTPSTWHYNTITDTFRKKGGKMGNQKRKAFTQRIATQSVAPGPGNYKLPTEFGHYKKLRHY